MAARNDPRMSNLLRYVSSSDGQPLLVVQVVMALASTPSKETAADPQTALHSDTFQPTAKAWLFLKDGPVVRWGDAVSDETLVFAKAERLERVLRDPRLAAGAETVRFVDDRRLAVKPKAEKRES